MMPDRLSGSKIVVVGGASGIGFAVAEAALEAGAEVTIASSRAANVEAAVARLAGARGEVVDVRDEPAVEAFCDRLGAIDHLAFTAGDWDRAGAGPLDRIDLSRLGDFLAVRFAGPIALAKHARIAPGGSLTLTGGMLAHRPFKGMALSTAFGGAVEHLALALAVEMAPTRVNCVCPGLVLTEHVTGSMPEAMRAAFTQRLPLPRAADPAEVAQAYLYAMRATYTTGQTLRVDGGGSAV